MSTATSRTSLEGDTTKIPVSILGQFRRTAQFKFNDNAAGDMFEDATSDNTAAAALPGTISLVVSERAALDDHHNNNLLTSPTLTEFEELTQRKYNADPRYVGSALELHMVASETFKPDLATSKSNRD